MEHQKIIHLLDSTTTPPSKFRKKNWFGINDGARGTCETNKQIKSKITMLKMLLFKMQCNNSCWRNSIQTDKIRNNFQKYLILGNLVLFGL